MNEIFVTFLMLTKNNERLEVVYDLGRCFIDSCMVNMFKDTVRNIQDFRPAQAMFVIINLLLQYFEPVLFNHLKQYSVTPELYATSWFVTLFSTKIPEFQLVFSLWREMVIENDPIFPCYLAISLLKTHEKAILDNKLPNVAQAISRIKIKNPEEIEKWIFQARSIKNSLPFSWKQMISSLNIHNLDTIQTSLEKLREMVSLTVAPQEFLKGIYPEFSCSCKGASCVWCRNLKIENFLLIDCRTYTEVQGGCLPESETFSQHLWENPYIIKDQVDEMMKFKGKKNIILMSSAEVNENYQFNPEQSLTNSQQMLIAFLTLFLEAGFPFVSHVQGGFKYCHEIVTRNKLLIVNHSKIDCQVCNPDRPASGFKKFTKSMSEVLKSTFTRVSTSFTVPKSESISSFSVPQEYINAKAFICRRFDKVTHDRSDEEFSLLVLKRQVILARFVDNNPKKVIKILEDICMTDILKITSMKKFPNVLTFCVTNKQICLIFNGLKDSKDCITLVTKLFRELKTS
jgi:rhodanese-related sulfurtransferase